MIVITGASKGLGRQIAENLHGQGHTVLGLSRNLVPADFECLECDVTSPESIKSVIQHLKHQKITVTGLINAAGVASMNLAITTPTDITQKIIQTNLLGTLYCCQLFSPLMIRNKGGRIINFSTIAVALGLKGESIYVASKAGVEGFSRSFAREMSDFNITVNCIAPGPIDTDLIRGVPTNKIQQIVKQQIINRQFTPQDICSVVNLLLSQESESLTGQVLHIGGA